MARKRLEAEVDIIDFEFPNKGVAIYDGKRIKIKNAIPEERVLVTIKNKKAEGILKEITKKADYEVEPECSAFPACGGCTFRHIPYEKEFELKINSVKKLLKDGGFDDAQFDTPIKCPSRTEYRNKMEFSFGDTEKNGTLALGMRKRNSFYEVVNADNCLIIHKDIRDILACVREYFIEKGEKFYHKTTHDGTLRHLIIRRTFFTGEILINLVTTSSFNINLSELSKKLFALDLEGKISGFLHTQNNTIADAVKPEIITLVEGKDYITEILLGLKFKISPFSFFQTNSEGAEKLYSVVRDFAGNAKDKTIFDLYCGTGTIGQILSQNAKKVVGIEIVEEAVEMAKSNALLNSIQNCEFIAGDVLKEVENLKGSADIIILDPPRDGIHPKAISKIAAFGAEKIIYISCKASSMTKDLSAFCRLGYNVDKIKCVDMYPGTYHIETVCLLEKTDISE